MPTILRSVCAPLLDVIFPPICATCGRRTTSASLAICDPCLRRPQRLKPEAARIVLEAAGSDTAVWARIFTLWAFDKAGTVQHLQHALKYGNRPNIGLQLGGVLGRAFADAYPGPDLEQLVVVPVPLSRSRLLERGYNQSEMLARGFARALDLPVDVRSLVRRRNTRSQIGLSRLERRENVNGAFGLESDDSLDGRSVVLVDDVITTGATLRAATEPLLVRPICGVSVAGLCLAGMQ